MIQKKMGRRTYIRNELERLRQRAAAAAEAFHTRGQQLADPEIESCKGLSTKLKDSDINDLIDEALKDIEMLGVAEQEKRRSRRRSTSKGRRKRKRRKQLLRKR